MRWTTQTIPEYFPNCNTKLKPIFHLCWFKRGLEVTITILMTIWHSVKGPRRATGWGSCQPWPERHGGRHVITPERNLGHMEEEHGGVAFIRNHTRHTHGHFKLWGFPLGILSNHVEQVGHFKDNQLKQKGSICLSPWFPSLDRTLGVGGRQDPGGWREGCSCH